MANRECAPLENKKAAELIMEAAENYAYANGCVVHAKDAELLACFGINLDEKVEQYAKLERAVIRELRLPIDISWHEVRDTIYPNKTLKQIWESLWVTPPDVDEYLNTSSRK